MPLADPSAPADALPPHPGLGRYYQGAKQNFVRQIFDLGAADYDRVERIMAMGSGSWYRRKALQRAGLVKGMNVLDVAVGTGLVAREEVTITGDSRLVIGVDPSAAMLAQARHTLSIRVARGVAERLPIQSDQFDFLSMGFALRHVSDLNLALAEFLRVLKPGGTLCILELTKPAGAFRTTLLKWYMRRVVPLLTRLVTRNADSQLLWEYYWDTIDACVPPASVLSALEAVGFENVKRYTELGIFSEYTARKPGECAGQINCRL